MSGDNLEQVFIEEAEEILADLENNLLELEDNPRDHELINEIFRAMHTLKGSASLTGLTKIADFVHHAENVLDKVRSNQLKIDSRLINLLLEARDLVAGMVTEVTDSDYQVPEGKVKDIAGGLKYYLDEEEIQSEAEEAETDQQERVYRVRLEFNENLFQTGTRPLLLIEELEEFSEIIDENINLTRIPEIYDLEPEKCFLTLTLLIKTAKLKEKISDVFVFVEMDNEVEIEDITDQFEAGLDVTLADKLTGEILVERGILEEEDIEEALSRQQRLGEILVREGKVSQEQVQEVVQKQQKSRQVKEKSTIKVETDKLEQLMNVMSELVISQSKVKELVFNKYDDSDTELVTAFEDVDKKIRSLQEEIMNTRMVPIGSTFVRFRRLVRDLAQEQGKEIDLNIKGKETELDKTVIEEITDPLKHMIRNSVDHGIEKPEVRAEKGKEKTGEIVLTAYHKEGNIIIEIADDGRGLDKDKILATAVDRGVIAEGADLSEQEIYQLIFEPGFSTNEEVTETSGRGVGMDVVKSNIERLRGSVNIETEPDQGTTFRLKLPLTLAIIDGMKIRIGKEKFIIPLNSIIEFTQPFARQLKSVEGKGEIVQIRNEYITLARLYQVLDLESEVTDPTEGIVIVVQEEEEKVCLLVDEILGQQQAVIKSLEDNYTYVEGMSGATILGDGSVAMILDIPTIINMAVK